MEYVHEKNEKEVKIIHFDQPLLLIYQQLRGDGLCQMFLSVHVKFSWHSIHFQDV